MLSVGEMLRHEREKKGISLQEIQKHIKIRVKFLEAIEENNWNFFSSQIYISGIVKNYSEYLGLDSSRLLAFFRRDYERKEDVHFKRRIASKYLTPETKKIALAGIIIIFIVFFGYFAFQLQLYLSPPKVTIISPQSDIVEREEKIKIIGKTDKDAAISIFGERVYQNKEGVFEYGFVLKQGKNEISIEVVGANGKKTIVKKIYVRKV
jgi:transcriptional regulator with XRE-family HTH domain